MCMSVHEGINSLTHSYFSILLRKHQWVKFILIKGTVGIPVTEDYIANWKEERVQTPIFALC